MNLKSLTNGAAKAYKVRFSSRDVREGICRLEDCNKAVPGLWYEPEEVLGGIFCFHRGSMNLFQHYSPTFPGEYLRSQWEEWVSKRGLLPLLAEKDFLLDLLNNQEIVKEIEDFVT